MTGKLIGVLTASVLALSSLAADLKITAFPGDGSMAVTGSYPEGVVTAFSAPGITGPWTPIKNAFSLATSAQLQFAPPGTTALYRALAVDVSSSGSWLLSANDIVDLASLVDELGLGVDGVSAFLDLSPGVLDALYSYGLIPDSEDAALLADALNTVIQGPSIYDPGVFAGVSLAAATQDLLSGNPQGSALIRLNRMLLDDAYPGILRNKQETGFPNLAQSFDLLTTVAGAGGTPISPNNKWLPESEGGPATNAFLSRPHIAMADRAGNIYIADKEAHAIRKVTLDGNIHTVAGNNVLGFGDTNPVSATSVSLNDPNGIWVFPDGKFYILDRENGLIRKVDTNGLMTLVVDHSFPLRYAIPEGRGLWVSPDESILYYCAGTQVMRWDTTTGLAVFAGGFYQLGNLAVDPGGTLYVTDRKANRAYRLASDGSRTIFAGNGSTTRGVEGYLATETGFLEVRGIWFLPTGACFLATDAGSQVWYVDTSGYVHLFLNGNSTSHSGDGSWFYDPTTPKVSKVRQITTDYDGNLIITENDAGYIRKVRFLHHQP